MNYDEYCERMFGGASYSPADVIAEFGLTEDAIPGWVYDHEVMEFGTARDDVYYIRGRVIRELITACPKERDLAEVVAELRNVINAYMTLPREMDEVGAESWGINPDILEALADALASEKRTRELLNELSAIANS